MPPKATASNVLYWILTAIDKSPEQSLKNVIINCHGGPGILAVGGLDSPFMEVKDIGLFSKLATKEIGTIWLGSCLVGQGGRGESFCSKLAQATHCDVIAGNDNQMEERQYRNEGAPFGTIDNFEGTAFRFSPAGGKVVYSCILPSWDTHEYA